MKTLKVGDKVLWRGSWGSEPALVVRVVGISLTFGTQDKGIPVESIPWDRAKDRDLVVDLDNGHWAYASQIFPLPKRMEDVA